LAQSAVEDRLRDIGRDIISSAELGKLIQSTAELKQGKVAPLPLV
jgi:hypothetical protein